MKTRLLFFLMAFSFANAQINVILITQGSSEHSICVGVDVASAARAKEAVDKTFEYEIATQKVEPLQIEKDLSIVALVGDQMRHHTGISGRMFAALGRNGVNIRAIAQGSTERNISAVVAAADVNVIAGNAVMVISNVLLPIGPQIVAG